MNHRQTPQNDLDRIRQFGADWAITFNAQKTVQQTITNIRDNRDFARTRHAYCDTSQTFRTDIVKPPSFP